MKPFQLWFKSLNVPGVGLKSCCYSLPNQPGATTALMKPVFMMHAMKKRQTLPSTEEKCLHDTFISKQKHSIEEK